MHFSGRLIVLMAAGVMAELVFDSSFRSVILLLPFLGAVLEGDEGQQPNQPLDDNGRRILLAIDRLKELGQPVRQKDIASEAGMSERTIAACRADSDSLGKAIDDAILFCLDRHLLKTAQRLQAEGGPVTYSRISAEAKVATETLRKRRESNEELNRNLEELISGTHPSDVKILAAVERLKARTDSFHSNAEIAREAGVDPATLRTRINANPALADTVNSIVLSTDDRIMKAIEDLRREGGELDQQAVAARAGVDPATVINRKAGNAAIREALQQAILSTDERIAAAVEKLKAGNVEITQHLIATEAGLSDGTVVHRKDENPVLKELIDDVVSNSMYRLIASAIRQLSSEGISITQQLIAQRLGVSESSIVYHKEQRPEIQELIESALGSSAVERIRQAKEEILVEDVPCTQRNIAIRAGVNTSTVSRLIAKNPDLADGVITAGARKLLFGSVEACLQALARRISVYGNELCNTATALRQATLRGGNPSLLRACRRFKVSLPVAQTDWLRRAQEGKAVLREYDPLSAYLERMSVTRMLDEQEAVLLWERTQSGDKEAGDELLVRARPLVKSVIEGELREQINPYGFNTELIWHLISEGDFILSSAGRQWDRRAKLLWFLAQGLREGLAKARLDFFRKRKQQAMQEVPISEPLVHDENRDFSLEQTVQMSAHNMSPEDVTAILTEVSAYGEEELIAKRDADSAVPVVSRYDKQVLASSLNTVIMHRALKRAMESGLGNKWAMFMTGSLGRMGTAVVGNCAFRSVLLSDATPAFLHRAAIVLSAVFHGTVRDSPGGVSTLVIGKGKGYNQVMAIVNGVVRKREILRHFVMSLQKFGIGFVPEEGIAAVDLVSLENEISDSLLFELLKNAIQCVESEKGARSFLIKKMVRRLRAQLPEDAGRALLDAQVSFLREQRVRLEWLKRRLQVAGKVDKSKPVINQKE